MLFKSQNKGLNSNDQMWQSGRSSVHMRPSHEFDITEKKQKHQLPLLSVDSHLLLHSVTCWQPSRHCQIACGQFICAPSHLCLPASCLWVWEHGHLKENRRTGGPKPLFLISSFTRNQHQEDVWRSLHCGFIVWWVVYYVCFDSEWLWQWLKL